MNIAIGALLILLLLFPGIVFRISYLNVPYGRKTFTLSFTDELLFSFIPAFTLQIIGYAIISHNNTHPDLGLLYRLLISDKPGIGLYEGLQQSFLPFSLYCFVLYVVAFIAGWLCRLIVRRIRLHQTSNILRFHNEWYALLSGEIIEQKKHKNPQQKVLAKDIAYALVHVLVDTRDESYIYTGILKDFVLSKDEGLDRIYLAGTRRGKLKDYTAPDTDRDSKSDNLIPGNYFMIPYREIKNLNVTYIFLKKKDKVVPPPPNPPSE